MRIVLYLGLLLLLAGAAGCHDGDDPPDHGLIDDDDDGAGDDDASGDDDDDGTPGDDDDGTPGDERYPGFFTANDDYFETHISSVPSIDGADYVLEVSGLVDQPRQFTLAELDALPATAVPLTVECIGNGVNGRAIGTASWEGFSLWDLLQSLGIQEGTGAAAVQITAADGYYASLTLDQARDEGVIGALWMNGEPLPADHGYPLRMVIPGYYGVKHPGWVTRIEVIDDGAADFWEAFGWDCTPTIGADSSVFFPHHGDQVLAGVPFEVGGAAWGDERIDRVEVSANDGASWTEATIVQSLDADWVWAFWEATITIDDPGDVVLLARATDHHGNVQPRDDGIYLDGSNAWPEIALTVVPAP